MADLNPIPFGGFAALDDPHLLTIQQGLTVQDCYLDNNAITGRNGYRSALATHVASSGIPQHMGRFRPTATSERIVAVIGGNVYLITEPSSQTASDGTAALLGTGTFGSTDKVCGTPLGANYYLVNDQSPATAVRIDSSYALHSLLGLPQAAQPTFSLSTLNLFPLSNLSGPTLSGLTLGASGITNWGALSGTEGGTAVYDLTSGTGPSGGYNWTNTQWLAVFASPETLSGGGNSFKIEIGDASGNWFPIANMVDPQNTNGSPWCVFANLSGLGIANNITQMRFTQGPINTDPFCVFGFMAFPTAPEPGTVDYYATYYDSVTGVESALSTALPVTYGGATPTFPAIFAAHWNYNNFVALGGRSTNPDSMTQSDLFNKGIGLAYPAAADFAPVYTFSGTIPTAAKYTNSDTVRLYRTTPVGISLVGSCIYTTRADGSAWTTGTGTASDFPDNYTFQTSSGTAWSITDNTGSTASANLTYVAGGPFPQSEQITGYAGRIASVYSNQISISSFTPVGVSTNPVPQWPPIAIETDDGWSYDVSPAPTELGQVINGDGDAVYIGTSEMVRSMNDLTPNSPPFVVMRRGVLGRQASGYFEQFFFWASYDGIYMSANQTEPVELTQEIRTYYQNVFQPTAALVLAYQARKLYAFQGNKFLRYDFVKKRWSTGTIADTVLMAISYISSTQIEELWLLCASRFIGRWQAACNEDMQIGTTANSGAAIPSWVFSTGFQAAAPFPNAVIGLQLDASGPVQVQIAKVADAIVPTSARNLFTTDQAGIDECWFPGCSDFRGFKMRFQFTAQNSVTLRRASYEGLLLPGTKGG